MITTDYVNSKAAWTGLGLSFCALVLYLLVIWRVNTTLADISRLETRIREVEARNLVLTEYATWALQTGLTNGSVFAVPRATLEQKPRVSLDGTNLTIEPPTSVLNDAATRSKAPSNEPPAAPQSNPPTR